MTDRTPIAPKLAKLIPRLGTSHDDEVVATVQAICRTLEAEGLDLHDLAATVTKPAGLLSAEPQTWAELAAWVAGVDGGRLRPHERDFVRNMVDRLVLGGTPTPRQGDWLRSLFARLRRGGR